MPHLRQFPAKLNIWNTSENLERSRNMESYVRSSAGKYFWNRDYTHLNNPPSQARPCGFSPQVLTSMSSAWVLRTWERSRFLSTRHELYTCRCWVSGTSLSSATQNTQMVILWHSAQGNKECHVMLLSAWNIITLKWTQVRVTWIVNK
jgi:hypothetical protein